MIYSNNMKDIKVMDSIRDSIESRLAFSPLEHFANAVEDTRMKRGGVSIRDIAKCFKAQFDEAELQSLINELQK